MEGRSKCGRLKAATDEGVIVGSLVRVEWSQWVFGDIQWGVLEEPPLDVAEALATGATSVSGGGTVIGGGSKGGTGVGSGRGLTGASLVGRDI